MTNKGEILENQIGYCETIQNLKNSPITSRIIDITSEKCGNIVDSEGEIVGENMDNSIEEIFTDFISNNPLTPDEQLLILGFLDDPKALKMAQNIFSKLKTPQGNDNKFLFDIYLKDAEGNFDITNFVKYLKHYIENYSLITRSDISDLSYQKTINETDYYTYKCADGTNSIFVITEGKIVYLDKPLFKILILDNGLIFGTQLNLQEQEGKESKEGIVLEFDGEKFIQIYNEPGLESLSKIDIPVKGYDYLYKSKKHGKKGLLEFSKVNEGKENTQITEILPPENNDVICNRSGFITTQNIEPTLKEKELEKQYKYTIYAKTDNYQGPPELPTMPIGQHQNISEHGLQHLKNIYKGPLSLKPLMPICEILSSDKEFKLNYLGDDYFMTILEDGSNIYKFNETNLSFAEIEGLRRIQTREFLGHKAVLINEKELLDGKPTEINYSNGNCQIAIFNKDTQTITSLILIKSDIYNTDIEKDRIKIKSGSKTFIFYYNDGKLYGLTKHFKYTKFNFIKDSRLKAILQKSIPLTQFYKEKQEYLEEVTNLPVIIN
ncbi:MAG: hypothetical protein WC850_05830 [Candidatus Gracilibacteria bacterium]